MKLLYFFAVAAAIPDYEKSSSFNCNGDVCGLVFENGPTFRTEVQSNGMVTFHMKFANHERWKPAEMIDEYGEGNVIDATKQGPKCVQETGAGQEDCLFLRVHTTKEVMMNKDISKMPTLFYIHGGGFKNGMAAGDFSNLVLNQGVVVIAVQYRLGIFGFGVIPEGEGNVRANWGFMDQQLGLSWASKFMGHFGGDKDEVTLTGCSAGGGGQLYQLQLEDSWPYFKRANPMGLGAAGAPPIEYGELVFNLTAGLTGCDTADDRLACMRQLPYQDLGIQAFEVLVQYETMLRSPGVPSSPKIGPVVDGTFVKYTIGESLSGGHIKPNTDLAWVVSSWDTWMSMAHSGLKNVYENKDIPELVDELPAFTDARDNGCDGKPKCNAPSDFSDKYFEQIYGKDFEQKEKFFELFGCPNGAGGEVLECQDPFAKWYNSQFWHCNFKFQWKRRLASFNYGKLYPFTMEIPSCDGGTKACHCTEKDWVLGFMETEEGSYLRELQDAFGSFFRTGEFPAPIKDWDNLGDNTNRIFEDKMTSDTPFRKEECDLLDELDNYYMTKLAFQCPNHKCDDDDDDDDDATTTTAEPTTTPEQTTADTRCDGLTIDALKVPQGKINPKGKWPTGGISERTFLTRYNLFNKGDGLGLWEKNYLGYVTFTKAMCGADFLNKIADGTLRLDVQDRTDCYIGVPAPALSSNGVTLQFYHSKTSLNNKQDLGSKKRDQMFLMVNGIDQVNFGKKKARTCLEKAKLFAIQDPDQIGEGKENLSRCVADHFESGR